MAAIQRGRAIANGEGPGVAGIPGDVQQDGFPSGDAVSAVCVTPAAVVRSMAPPSAAASAIRHRHRGRIEDDAAAVRGPDRKPVAAAECEPVEGRRPRQIVDQMIASLPSLVSKVRRFRPARFSDSHACPTRVSASPAPSGRRASDRLDWMPRRRVGMYQRSIGGDGERRGRDGGGRGAASEHWTGSPLTSSRFASRPTRTASRRPHRRGWPVGRWRASLPSNTVLVVPDFSEWTTICALSHRSITVVVAANT